MSTVLEFCLLSVQLKVFIS